MCSRLTVIYFIEIFFLIIFDLLQIFIKLYLFCNITLYSLMLFYRSGGVPNPSIITKYHYMSSQNHLVERVKNVTLCFVVFAVHNFERQF